MSTIATRRSHQATLVNANENKCLIFFNLRIGHGPVRANLSAHSPTWTDLVALDLKSEHLEQ